MFKELGAMAQLFKQAQTIAPKMQAALESLKSQEVVGEAGGGMVRVVADGLGMVHKVEIDPLLVEKNEWEMACDLLPAAINAAAAKAKELHMRAMQEATGELPFGDNMEGMLKNFLGSKD
jgi:DNA-binding YbaB/EbfC family protein